MSDVTERRQALQQLRDNLDFVDALVESTPMPVYLKDASGHFTRFNKAFLNVFKVDAEAWLGKTALELWGEEQAHLHLDSDRVMLYLLAVVMLAVRFGRGPGVLASFIAVGVFDFFFVPPRMARLDACSTVLKCRWIAWFYPTNACYAGRWRIAKACWRLPCC